eukprot:TRINITY_DN2650_c0_g1_i4.p1 TRINITY_DN2650_c0_g1~~TRINITY_DN2650_c0_g1_i4.p1  ORF type:complete len:207 (-),score=33.02 TRINITY_DN2650_c0_g1_i4:172-792(-)
MALPNAPGFLEYNGIRVMIMDAPTDTNAPVYLEELKRQQVKNVVRVCEPTYSTELFAQNGIKVHDWPFPDGEAPPTSVVSNWLGLLQQVFSTPDTKETIAVHCIAGLGRCRAFSAYSSSPLFAGVPTLPSFPSKNRAPVLAAIALIERGMEPLDAVEFIRKKRRGAINQKQLTWLEKCRFLPRLCALFSHVCPADKRRGGKPCCVM